MPCDVQRRKHVSFCLHPVIARSIQTPQAKQCFRVMGRCQGFTIKGASLFMLAGDFVDFTQTHERVRIGRALL